jgi:putative FmdB family regulatory protein
MPTYEYACVDCGKHIEVVQSMSDPPLTVCAACGGRLRKVFAPIGIVFKGSGFYRTDSRGKSTTSKESPAASKETSTTKSSSDSSSSGSSDSGDSSKSDSASKSKSKPASKPAEKSA